MKSLLADVDVRDVERLILKGEAHAALELANDARRRTEQPTQQVTLDRMTGWGHAQLGDSLGAFEAFDRSLEVAIRVNARYEEALTRQAITRVTKPPEQQAVEGALAAEVFVTLGVISTPEIRTRPVRS